MKNIKPYAGDSMSFHKSIVIDSLNDSETKQNLVENESLINGQYVVYKDKFDNKDLHSIDPYGFDGEDKSSLLKLYSSQRKPLKELRVVLTTNERNERDNLCPNCTIGEVASLDHFIPKDEFPEFSVNPINLVPCCSTCNSKKKDNWKDNDKMLFLNLYADVIPNIQYLFVEVKSKLDFKFVVDNRNNIDENLFEIIDSHYEKLGLTQRFRENSDKIITELAGLISSFSSLVQEEELVRVIKKHYKDKEPILGVNNWEIVLSNVMIDSGMYF